MLKMAFLALSSTVHKNKAFHDYTLFYKKLMLGLSTESFFAFYDF